VLPLPAKALSNSSELGIIIDSSRLVVDLPVIVLRCDPSAPNIYLSIAEIWTSLGVTCEPKLRLTGRLDHEWNLVLND